MIRSMFCIMNPRAEVQGPDLYPPEDVLNKTLHSGANLIISSSSPTKHIANWEENKIFF